MKKIILLAVLVGAGYYGYQSYYSSGLYGEWWLDVDAMREQLADARGPSSTVEEFVGRNANGQTKAVISKDHMVVTLMGEGVTLPYKEVSKEGNCHHIVMDSAPNRDLKYCIDGDRLSVHSPHSHVVEHFKRHRSSF
jgi:hypothetical protein